MMNLKLLCLLILTLLCVNTLVADISVPDAPVEIAINVSKDEIYVGDSIDVYATITLLKDHMNYSEKSDYYVRLMPDTNWEIIYSDSTKIINSQNTSVSFHYRAILAKKPTFISVFIPRISVQNFEMVDIGNKMMRSLITQKINKTSIECVNDGLKERPDGRPRTALYNAEIHPKVQDMSRTIPIKTEYLIREINIDKSHLVEGKNYYVHVNTTTAFKFSSPISDVTCDSFIGSVSTSNQYEITYKSTDAVGSKGYIYLKMDGQNWQMHIELTENSDAHAN